MKQIYTTLSAGQLRKCHWNEARIKYAWKESDWKISIGEGWLVFFCSNSEDFNGGVVENKLWYSYSWILYRTMVIENDDCSGNAIYNWIEIDLGEEKKELPKSIDIEQEVFVEGEEVEVEMSNGWEAWVKRIYISTFPWKIINKYIVVAGSNEEDYKKWLDYYATYWSKIRKLQKPKTKKELIKEYFEKNWMDDWFLDMIEGLYTN